MTLDPEEIEDILRTIIKNRRKYGKLKPLEYEQMSIDISKPLKGELEARAKVRNVSPGRLAEICIARCLFDEPNIIPYDEFV